MSDGVRATELRAGGDGGHEFAGDGLDVEEAVVLCHELVLRVHKHGAVNVQLAVLEAKVVELLLVVGQLCLFLEALAAPIVSADEDAQDLVRCQVVVEMVSAAGRVVWMEGEWGWWRNGNGSSERHVSRW